MGARSKLFFPKLFRRNTEVCVTRAVVLGAFFCGTFI